jgi:hypothetical protein
MLGEVHGINSTCTGNIFVYDDIMVLLKKAVTTLIGRAVTHPTQFAQIMEGVVPMRARNQVRISLSSGMVHLEGSVNIQEESNFQKIHPGNLVPVSLLKF